MAWTPCYYLAFTLFFPVQAAVAMTAVVHFLNNLSKLTLLGKEADRAPLWNTGHSRLLFGAWLLLQISEAGSLFTYTLLDRHYNVTPPKLLMVLLMLAFALFEASSLSEKIVIADRRYLVPGELLSGFFDGLSGHQRAFRSAFLVSSGLSKLLSSPLA